MTNRIASLNRGTDPGQVVISFEIEPTGVQFELLRAVLDNVYGFVVDPIPVPEAQITDFGEFEEAEKTK